MHAVSTADKLAVMEEALAFLGQHYTNLSRPVREAIQVGAMNLGRALMDDPNTARADFMRAYNLTIELDRVSGC